MYSAYLREDAHNSNSPTAQQPNNPIVQQWEAEYTENKNRTWRVGRAGFAVGIQHVVLRAPLEIGRPSSAYR